MREDVIEFLEKRFPYGFFVIGASEATDHGDSMHTILSRYGHVPDEASPLFVRHVALMQTIINNPERFEPFEQYWEDAQ